MSEQPADAGACAPPADDAEALQLLRDGEIDLEGRLLDASNVTLVGTDPHRRRWPPSASTSRWRGSGRSGTSPTARSPAGRSRRSWCPRPPAGGSCRPRCCATGPFGPGMVQLWMDGDEDVDLPAFVRRDDPGAAPDGRVRRGGQQRRPQGRAHHPDARRPRVRRRPRHLLLRRPEAAHAAVALGRQAAAGRGASRCWSGSATSCAATWGSSCTST